MLQEPLHLVIFQCEYIPALWLYLQYLSIINSWTVWGCSRVNREEVVLCLWMATAACLCGFSWKSLAWRSAHPTPTTSSTSLFALSCTVFFFFHFSLIQLCWATKNHQNYSSLIDESSQCKGRSQVSGWSYERCRTSFAHQITPYPPPPLHFRGSTENSSTFLIFPATAML